MAISPRKRWGPERALLVRLVKADDDLWEGYIYDGEELLSETGPFIRKGDAKADAMKQVEEWREVRPQYHEYDVWFETVR